METKRLPEYWAVENDGSLMFRDLVVAYLNSRYNMTFNGIDAGLLYGYDGTAHVETDISMFAPGTVVLRFDEFIKIAGSTKNDGSWIDVSEELLRVLEEGDYGITPRWRNLIDYLEKNFEPPKRLNQ